MEFITEAWAWWQAHEAMILKILGGALVIALAWPGEHPDKEFQAIIDFIKKFSRKPKK